MHDVRFFRYTVAIKQPHVRAKRAANKTLSGFNFLEYTLIINRIKTQRGRAFSCNTKKMKRTCALLPIIPLDRSDSALHLNIVDVYTSS